MLEKQQSHLGLVFFCNFRPFPFAHHWYQVLRPAGGEWPEVAGQEPEGRAAIQRHNLPQGAHIGDAGSLKEGYSAEVG